MGPVALKNMPHYSQCLQCVFEKVKAQFKKCEGLDILLRAIGPMAQFSYFWEAKFKWALLYESLLAAEGVEGAGEIGAVGVRRAGVGAAGDDVRVP